LSFLEYPQHQPFFVVAKITLIMKSITMKKETKTSTILGVDCGIAVLGGWAVLVSCTMIAFVSALFWLYDEKYLLEQSDLFTSYLLTFAFLFGYARIGLHVGMKGILSKYSNVFRSMPESLQNDCAFNFVDGFTLFLWWPVYYKMFCGIFLVGPGEYFNINLSAMKLVMAMYHMDRILQLMNQISAQRFVHHVCACLWTLSVIEWFPNRYNTLFFLTGTFLEVVGKVVYPIIFLVRMTLQNLKLREEGWTSLTAVDRLLVADCPDRAVLVGRVAYVGYLLFTYGPLTIFGIYASHFYDVLPTSQLILTPLVLCCFNFVDIPYGKWIKEKATLKYWEKVFDKAEAHVLDGESTEVDSDSDSSLGESSITAAPLTLVDMTALDKKQS
jgi:hypothetical protein